MFGTLYVPDSKREPLTFGFADDPDAHTVKGELVNPLIKAAGHFRPLWPKRAAKLPNIPVAERNRA
jgi:hypothetical protein